MPSSGWTRLLPVVVAAGLVGAGLSAPAYAHNQLTSSTPEDGEVLDEAPASVTLDFLDTLEPANTTVTVTGPDGRAADAGPPEFDGSVVTLPLAVSSAGDYTVGYELLAADGHVGTGEVRFRLTVQAAPSPTPPPPAPSPPAPSPTPAPEPTGTRLPAAAPVRGEPASWWLWPAGAAAALALGLGGALWFRRSRAAGPG